MTRGLAIAVLGLLLQGFGPALADSVACVPLEAPIRAAQKHFETLEGYRALLTSTEIDGAGQVIRYYFKAPGFVRMEFVKPNRGALLLYDPVEDRVTVWPFGPRGFSLSLDPGNFLIRSPSGHRVDRSHVGALLENIRDLQQEGTTQVVGLEDGEAECLVHVRVVGAPDGVVNGVHRYELWLERERLFPSRVEAYDPNDRLIEAVTLTRVVLDPAFREDFFRQPR